MTDQFVERDPVEQLAEDFMARLRRGDRPALSEYTTAHPNLADEIRELFPALVLMEEAKPAGSEPSVSSASLEPPPDRLGDYRILREVARGGMGVVFEAEQVTLGRHVALKILPARSDADPVRLLRFRREARSAARLHHTNIVPVFDVGAADGVHYYAMQFIQGQGLDEVLQELIRLRSGVKATDAPALTVSLADGLRSGTFSGAPFVPIQKPVASLPTEASAILAGPVTHYFRSVARLGLQAADALAYAHGQRVLHRDVKPSNLLLDRQGTLWLTDFGLAKDDGDDLTRTGDLVGTLRYMAPERFQGVSDPRSDVYALGVTLYELLTLRPAFPEADRVRLIHSVTKVDPPRPRLIDPTIPRDLETIVLKAIEKEPGRRYSLAEDLAEDLRRFLADRPIQARRASWREQGWRWCRRNPGVAISMATAALVLASGIAVSTFQAVRATRAEGLAEGRLGKQVEANREARHQLFKARCAEAQASRYSRRAGQRFKGLAAITEAAALARELGLGDEFLAQLRDDAIACLALADVRLVTDWDTGVPAGSYYGLAPDADLKHYARSDPSGNIHVHRLVDNDELAVLPVPDAKPRTWDAELRFSPDGTRLAVIHRGALAGGKTNFRLWDWQRDKIVFEPPFVVSNDATDFSPDGRGIVVCQSNGMLRKLDTDTGRVVWKVNVGGPIVGVAFHPDGTTLALGRRTQKEVQLRRSDTGELIRTLPTPNGCQSAPVWSPDGVQLAVAGTDNRHYLYDMLRPGEPTVLSGHEHDGVWTCFAPGSGLAMGSCYESIHRLWDPCTRRELLRFEGGLGWFDRSGERFASFAGQRIKLWELAPGREYRTLPTFRTNPDDGMYLHPVLRGGGISRDGRWLGLGTKDGLRLWDLDLNKEIPLPVTPDTRDVKFHPSGNELYTCGPDGVFAWAMRETEDCLRIGPARAMKLKMQWSEIVCLDQEGLLLAGATGSSVQILDLKDPARDIPPLRRPNTLGCAISSNGRWVASGNHLGRGAVVRDIDAGKDYELVPEEWSTRVAFSPDDRWLAIATSSGCGVWRVGTWERVANIPREEQSGSARETFFSPDGRILAMPLSPSAIRLIDTETWLPLARFQSPEADAVGVVGFTPDSGRLVVATRAGPVHIWDLRLIREQLRTMGLDWDHPPYQAPPATQPRSIRVELDPARPKR